MDPRYDGQGVTGVSAFPDAGSRNTGSSRTPHTSFKTSTEHNGPVAIFLLGCCTLGYKTGKTHRVHTHGVHDAVQARRREGHCTLFPTRRRLTFWRARVKRNVRKRRTRGREPTTILDGCRALAGPSGCRIQPTTARRRFMGPQIAYADLAYCDSPVWPSKEHGRTLRATTLHPPEEQVTDLLVQMLSDLTVVATPGYVPKSPKSLYGPSDEDG